MKLLNKIFGGEEREIKWMKNPATQEFEVASYEINGRPYNSKREGPLSQDSTYQLAQQVVKSIDNATIKNH